MAFQVQASLLTRASLACPSAALLVSAPCVPVPSHKCRGRTLHERSRGRKCGKIMHPVSNNLSTMVVHHDVSGIVHRMQRAHRQYRR
jgi:hypothetical protein